MTDLDKEIDDIVTPIPEPKTNWLLVSTTVLGTILLVAVIGWATGYIGIGRSGRLDTAANDVAAEGGPAPRIKGNRLSRIYHLPRCDSYDRVAPENVRWFVSEENAIKANYRKARNC